MENQPESILVELIHYNNWANAQVFAACQKLSADQAHHQLDEEFIALVRRGYPADKPILECIFASRGNGVHSPGRLISFAQV